MPAIASGHGVASGSAAFWASCAATAAVIAANANSATVILAYGMRFPSCVLPCPALRVPSLLERNEITRRDSRPDTDAVDCERRPPCANVSLIAQEASATV